MWGAWGDALSNWSYTQWLYGPVLSGTYNNVLYTNIW